MAKRILVVEDEPDAVKALIKRLMNAGFDVHYAPDAVTGIREAHQFNPDLIILDIMLPAGGGLGVLEALKLSVKLNFIPVVILSAMENKEHKDKIMSFSNVEAYFAKPYESQDVIAKINNILAP